MTNLIFKSRETYNKISNQLEIILSELRHQRSDNVLILSLLSKLAINSHLQKQADDFYQDSEDYLPGKSKA